MLFYSKIYLMLLLSNAFFCTTTYAQILTPTNNITAVAPVAKPTLAEAGVDMGIEPTMMLVNNPVFDKRDSLIALTRIFLGRPYIWGGTTPYGFDCSGFAWYVFKQFGYSIPRMSGDQATLGRWVNSEESEPGDLVFYGYPYGAGHIYTHTAIIYERDSKNNVSVIHSSLLGLAITTLHFDPNYTCRLIGIKRVIE